MNRQTQGIAILFLLSGLAWGESAHQDRPELVGAGDTADASDGISATLARRLSLWEAFDEGLTPNWIKMWRSKREALLKRVDLNLSAAYDSLALVSLGGGDQPLAASGELSLTGNWTLWGKERDRPLDLRFRMRNRHAYGDRSPSELADDIGALWGVVDGFSDRAFEIPEFYLNQRFLRRDLQLRYGQLSMESQLDSHALRGAKQSFLNRAFSSNPAVAFPRFGAGMTLHWDHASGFDLTAGATTVQATKTGDQVDLDFGASDLFEAVQFGYDFAGLGSDPARVQMMLWHSDAIQAEGIHEGSGAAFTFEQAMADRDTRLFLRLAWSESESTDLSYLGAGGIGVTCRDFDLFGLAVGAGHSAGPSKRWQAVLESFYRWQITPELHVTPDCQFLIGDGFRGGGDLRILFGLRAQVAF